MKKTSKQNKKGFTLVELIVVISIIGILAGIAIPRFMEATKSARGAKIIADMRTIESATNVYYAKYGKYPASQSTDGFANIVNSGTWPTPPIGSFTIVHTIGGTADGPTVGTCDDSTTYTYAARTENDLAGAITLTGTTALSNCANNNSPTVTELLAGPSTTAYDATVSNIGSLFSLYDSLTSASNAGIGINFINAFINSDADRTVSDEFLAAYNIDTGFNEDLRWYADYNKRNDGTIMFLTTPSRFNSSNNNNKWSAVLVVTEDGTVYTSNATNSSGETDFASIRAAVAGDNIPSNTISISDEIGVKLMINDKFTAQDPKIDI